MFAGLMKLMTKNISLPMPPKHTPDLCLLENHEYHWVFDHDNAVHSPMAFNYAFTDQRFYMWQKNHVPGTPHILLRENAHPRCISRRARVKGKVHTMTAKEIVAIDNKLENGVKYERRKVRLILPFPKEIRRTTVDEVTPTNCWAWIYVDKLEYWKDKFQFDADIWRGREGSQYIPVKSWKDNRAFIGPYFTPKHGPATPTKLQTALWRHTYNNFKASVRAEENLSTLQEEEKIRRYDQGHKLTPALPQVS